MRFALRLAVLGLICGAPTGPLAAAQITFPALSGRVVDQANILDPATEQAIANAAQSLETATTNQLVVVTLASLQGQTIEDFGYQLGRQWGIGRAGKNNGILLIVAPNERTVRIEVGYGLEGTITDALSKGIIEREILPRFRETDFNGGVRAGASTIVAILMGDAKAAASYTEIGSRKVSPPHDWWRWIGFVLVLAPLAIWTINRRHPLGNPPPSGPWDIARHRRLRQRARQSGGNFWWGGGGFGGGSGGFGGGGGFSGGGGSFGGGGASGNW